MEFVSNEINIEYKNLFINEAHRVTQSIIDYEQNQPEKFVVCLTKTYKSITRLSYADPLADMRPLNLLDNQIKGNCLHNVMLSIQDQLQNEFVIPILKFFETNYPQILFEKNNLIDSLKELLNEINKDELYLKLLPDNNTDKSQYAVYSKLNSCCYYLEYNSFNDLLSYRKHLDNVYSQFVQYLRRLKQIITDPIEWISICNKIKTYISEALSQFDIIPKQKIVTHTPLPNFIRKDTLALLKQYVNNNFIQGESVTFNPGLGDFQDLQYSIGKKALHHVDSKIKIMKFALEINGKPTIPSHTKATNLPDLNKIKTELTVNQISFIIRCLHEEKGILDEPNKIAFCRKLATILSSTRQENISAVSIKNKFTTYDDKAVEFWIEKFTHFLQFARKIREENHTGKV